MTRRDRASRDSSSVMNCEPMFDVMMMTVFLKSMFSLPVRDPAVIEHLQEHVEHVLMGLFYFIEEND